MHMTSVTAAAAPAATGAELVVAPLPPRLPNDASQEEKAAREAIMKERRRIQKAINEQKRGKRDRSEREQLSGAQHRKQAEAEAKRADANRRRQSVSQHRRAAREKKRPRLGESFGSIRQREEQRLLGNSFVFEDQRVRVCEGVAWALVQDGAASGVVPIHDAASFWGPEWASCLAVPVKAGQCGTVLRRAELCVQEKGGSVSSLKLSSAGFAQIEGPQHFHTVQLDDVSTPVMLSPYHVQPWPAIGQEVGWMPSEPQEIATVKYFHNTQDPDFDVDDPEDNSYYVLSRQFYALPAHVEVVAPVGGRVRVGSWVRLREPHPEADPDDGAWGFREPPPAVAAEMLSSVGRTELTPADVERLMFTPQMAVASAHVLVVKSICEDCGQCLELEDTFYASHRDLTPLIPGWEQREPCRFHCTYDHQYLCDHMFDLTHVGECVWACKECDPE